MGTTIIRVAALTGGRFLPSARFRVRQYIPWLQRSGLQVHEYVPLVSRDSRTPLPGTGFLWPIAQSVARLPGMWGSRQSDVTWIQKELVPRRAWLERFVHRPRLFDVDDAIWLQGKSADQIARRVDGIIAGNSYVADHFASYNARIWIVPTAVDTLRWLPRSEPSGDEVVIGWTGGSKGHRDVYAIEPALQSVLTAVPNARLLMITDRPPRFQTLPSDRVTFVPWSPQREVPTIQSMDIGIMPLNDTPWSRGKCSYKMLLYMSVGIPVVASPVGMNSEVLSRGEVGLACDTHEQWAEAIIELARSIELRRCLGAAGRQVVETFYSVNGVAPQLATILRSVV